MGDIGRACPRGFVDVCPKSRAGASLAVDLKILPGQ